MSLHALLETDYGPNGDARLRELLGQGADPNGRAGALAETPLHVATRRRRGSAVTILLEHGAEVDATTAGGKTAYAHAARRNFDELVAILAARGANTTLGPAARFAVAVVEGRLDDARAMLMGQPGLARTGNPEEDRLLADVAGRGPTAPVELLIAAGADLAAPGLDGASPLHQAAWFGQPDNARLLIDAGAPLDVVDPTHHYTPLGWAAHGSRYSGGAEERQDVYVAIARLLIDAGASLEPRATLLEDASPAVAELLRAV